MLEFRIGSNVVNFSNMEFVKERLENVRRHVQGHLEDAEMRRELCRAQIMDSQMEYGEILFAHMHEYSELCDQISGYKTELATFECHFANIAKLELTSKRIQRDLGAVERDLAKMLDSVNFPED
ncbi:hypothetical protein CAEBREN_01970 [Caenorhabditis brenneri]|uniref:Uncharacterized protein n=1 Tax=Caenorhabditis brenneri TaxID=135651 RepID=G0ME66_CAEBE|nr:hypothetical protein CAEBREN_01970 [Caenorhabditis brenneri]